MSAILGPRTASTRRTILPPSTPPATMSYMPRPNDEPPDERLRQLYPDLSDEGLSEAGYNLDRYVEVAIRICESLNDPARAEQLGGCSNKRRFPIPASSGRSKQGGQRARRMRRFLWTTSSKRPRQSVRTCS